MTTQLSVAGRWQEIGGAGSMKIAGSIHANLRAAMQSVRRLKDGPVHPDTVDHWASLVHTAKAEPVAMESFRTRELMSDLEREINERRSSIG